MKHSLGKILSALLAITLVLGMLPVCGFAAESTDTYIADCPSFTLRGPEGVYPRDHYDENGILLLFGRTGCANTRALLGELTGRAEALNAQGVQVFANLEDTFLPEDYADIRAVYPNITYTYGDGVLRKVMFQLAEPDAEGFYFPLVFVINRDGQIIHYSTGYVSDMQTLLSKVDAVATGQQLPDPDPVDENYYGSVFNYTGDETLLAEIIRQQLAAQTADIVIRDGTWDGEGDSWVGETLAYAMFDILESAQEEYGPYTIPDTWIYSPWAQQVAISIVYPEDSPAPTEPETTEPEVTEPEVTEPEVTEPEVTEPEVTEPEVTEPEVTEPEVTEPEVTEPEVSEPEVTEPEVTEPEVSEPEVTEPEVIEPDATEPEVTEPEITDPDATEPEVTEPEVTDPEVTEPEETTPEETQPEENKPVENPFVDVAEDAYYAAPVLWAVEKGITNGMTETTFAPDGTCTRAQIVTFLWRAKGSPAPASANNPFADVPAGQWYTDAVLWAVEKGITTGTSATTFSPDTGCTRGQVATFLWRSEGEPASGGSNVFTDIAPGAYYYDAVLWAVENGITNGMGDGTFAPDATCTRGQIVTFLHRAMT